MVSEAQKKAVIKYLNKNYKQINIRVNKEEADDIDKAVAKTGMSKAAFILQAIKEKLERDGYVDKKKYELLCDNVTIFSSDSLEDAEKRLIYETEKMGHNGHYEIVENEL